MTPGARPGGHRSWPRRRTLLLALGAAALGGVRPRRARGETWGGITPGESAQKDVQALFGRPTRERTVVEDGRTTMEWTYVGERAPRGMERMVVTYGLLRQDGGFAPDLVRALTLYPRPHVFSRRAIDNGWGVPDATGREEATGRASLHYQRRGLLIIMDRTGAWAEMLLFAPRAGP